LKKGQPVEFDLAQRPAGEFVIERLAPQAAAHKGH
jgi:hypothetical protein